MRFDATDKAAGKRPTLLKWEEVCATADEAEIRRWSVDHGQRDCLNTGLLCGHVIGLDIDVPDYPLACRINALADAMLPPTPLIRIGKSPKSLRAFRAEGVHTKASTPALFLPDGTKVQIEALGKGNHFVSFGTHPDTKLPYTWPHQSPLDVRFEDLPVLPAATLRAFLKAAEADMRAAGGRTEAEIKDAAEGKVKPAASAPKKPRTTTHSNNFPPPTYDDVREALAAIPNRHDWQGWVKIGAAIYDALADDGEDLFTSWSEQSSRNDPDATRKKWKSFSRSKMNISDSTLFWEARQNGWKPQWERERDEAAAAPARKTGNGATPPVGAPGDGPAHPDDVPPLSEDDPPPTGWRPVTPEEVFEPGRSFRMNQTTGVSEVYEPPGASPPPEPEEPPDLPDDAPEAPDPKEPPTDPADHPGDPGPTREPTPDDPETECPDFDPAVADFLSVHTWAALAIKPERRLLGDLITSSTKAFISGTTGIGKTMFLYGVAGGMASGKGFLHWTCDGPSKWLIIDGEMPQVLVKARSADLLRRGGPLLIPPHGVMIYSRDREDEFARAFPDLGRLSPLNSDAGHTFVQDLIVAIRPDGVIFDNVMSLAPGDQKDEEVWAGCIPLVEYLSRNSIAQIWADHTGHNTGRQYGSSTKSWRFDIGAMLSPLTGDDEPTPDHLAFKLSFDPPGGKARRRTPDNWRDFAPQVVRLVDNEWTAEPVDRSQTAGDKGLSDKAVQMFQTIKTALNRFGIPQKIGEDFAFTDHIAIDRQILRQMLVFVGFFPEGSLLSGESETNSNRKANGRDLLSTAFQKGVEYGKPTRAGLTDENNQLRSLKRKGIIDFTRDYLWRP